jgi:hypothetical protein
MAHWLLLFIFLFKLNGPCDQVSEPVHEVHSGPYLLIQPKIEVTYSPWTLFLNLYMESSLIWLEHMDENKILLLLTFNPFTTEINLIIFRNFTSYRTENTVHIHDKEQLINSIYGNNSCLS